MAGTFAIHEHLRWGECSQVCMENQRLLLSDVCKPNSYYGASAKDICAEAMRETELSPFGCTARRFWKSSEIYRVYNMYAESYWMLIGITVPCLLFIIHHIFAACSENRMHARMERLFLENKPPTPTQAIEDVGRQIMLEHEKRTVQLQHHPHKPRRKHPLVEFAKPFVPHYIQ